MAALRRWSIVLGVVALFSATFTGLRRYLAFREARWVEASLRDRLFAHLQRLHFAFHDKTQTGQLMSRANTDLQQIQAFVVMIPLTISNAVTVLSVTVILLVIDPVLTLLALGSLPFLNVVATRFSRRLFPHVMGIQRESAELAAVVEESVAGVRVIKGLGAEGVQADRLAAEAEDVYVESMAAARVRSTYLPALELLPNIGLIAVLGYGGHQVLNGDLSLGSLLLFNVYIAMLIWPLRMLGMIVAQSQRAAVSAERVDEVLSTDAAVDDPAASDAPARRRGPGRGLLRGRALRLRRAPGARRVRPADRPGRVGGVGRGHGIGQDDGGPPHPTVLRRGRGHGPPRRRRRPPGRPHRAATGDRHRVRGHLPVQRHDRRQHRLRRPRRPARGDRARRPAGRRPRLHRQPGRGVRDTHRRAGLLAVRRPAAAHRHRPRHPRRPAGSDPRRRHVGGRPDEGARDPRRADRGHARSVDRRDRPPARHDRPGRSRRAPRGGPGRGRGHPPRPPGDRGPLPAGAGRRRPRREAPTATSAPGDGDGDSPGDDGGVDRHPDGDGADRVDDGGTGPGAAGLRVGGGGR